MKNDTNDVRHFLKLIGKVIAYLVIILLVLIGLFYVAVYLGMAWGYSQT